MPGEADIATFRCSFRIQYSAVPVRYVQTDHSALCALNKVRVLKFFNCLPEDSVIGSKSCIKGVVHPAASYASGHWPDISRGCKKKLSVWRLAPRFGILWLNGGNVCFFGLRRESPLFLSHEVNSYTAELETELHNHEFLSELAFVADVTVHVNELHLKLLYVTCTGTVL
jgi:hypothetical protein